MKRILHTSLLALYCLLASGSWAQDDANKAETTASDAATEETTDTAAEESEAPAAAQRPIRLPANTPRSREPANDRDAMATLAKNIPEGAQLWLETRNERFLGFWQEDRSGDPKGALLILHAEGEHPNWPVTTRPLHDTLPNYGWATLAISLPSPDLPEVARRSLPVKVKPIKLAETDEETEVNEGADKADGETDSTEAMAEAEQATLPTPPPTPSPAQPKPEPKTQRVSAELITEQRLETALRFLHDQGQFNLIIVGNGAGAIRAQDFIEKITPKVTNKALKDRLEKPFRALVLVNGRNRLPSMEKDYDKWFSDPEVPVLDIFLKTDSRNQQDSNQRKVIARQKQVLVYQQVRLSALNAEKSWGENRLSRRIRSFLDNNAVGIEVKNAKINRI